VQDAKADDNLKPLSLEPAWSEKLASCTSLTSKEMFLLSKWIEADEEKNDA